MGIENWPESRHVLRPTWKKITEALEAVTTTFQGDLEVDWLGESTAYSDEEGVPWLAQGYPALRRWIQSKLALEVRDLELDARQALFNRACTQGELSVTQYANALKRAVRDIPVVTNKELILWFLSGLRTGIAHFCKCDTKGKPWTRYEDLVDHARAKESELNSRKGVQGDTPGKSPSRRFGNTWHKTDGKTDKSLAVAHYEPQASKGAWKVTPPGKKARFASPDPVRGANSGRASGSGGGSDKAEQPRKDWEHELPGPDQENCVRYPWLSNEQARWCGKKGLCLYCYKSRNDCPSPKTCTGRPAGLALLEIRKDAPKRNI